MRAACLAAGGRDRGLCDLEVNAMTWYEAVLSALGIILFWPALWLIGDLVSAVHQHRMTATLWRSLPYDPGPGQQERDRVKAAAAGQRMAELEHALLDPPEATP
jgi:hypothetical protein